MEEVSRKTIAKYLGYRGKPMDEPTYALIEEALLDLAPIVPRHVLLRLPLSIAEHKVIIEGFQVESQSLSSHLARCNEAVLLAATLGVQADQLIGRASITRMSKAVVLQACAAAKLEAYLNGIGHGLAREVEAEGLYLTPRFSPGYGDLPLACQTEMLTLLEAGKRIGLGLTADFLLTPIKSVTAIIGLSRKKQSACYQVCQRCPHTACPFREE